MPDVRMPDGTVVRFPDVGEKRLLLSWAPIEKVQR